MVREPLLQVDGLFKMVAEVHKEYNAVVPVEQQNKDGDCFDETDPSILPFK